MQDRIRLAIGVMGLASGPMSDGAAVKAAQRAAVEAAAVAQQWLGGQFWTDAKFKDAFRQAALAR